MVVLVGQLSHVSISALASEFLSRFLLISTAVRVRHKGARTLTIAHVDG